MRRLTLYILISIFTFVIAGAFTTFGVVRRYVYGSEGRAISCSSILPARYTTVESTILKDSDSSWRYDEITTTGKEDLHAIQFINANEGWVGGSSGALYKTTNAGKDWQKIPLNIPPESYVISISFVNSSAGWLVAQVEGNEFRDLDSIKSWVLNTTDGGKTWQTQFQDKSLRMERVQFVDEHEGWAVGFKLSKHEFYKGFVIRTTDGGQHWINLSANVPDKKRGNGEAITNIVATGASKATILKFSGTFFSTGDSGQTWAQVGSLPKEPPQAFLGQFDLIGGNRMWAIGGADSIEGMWGTLARMDGDCSWRKYSIGGVYFADATFVSENEVLICGTIPSPGNVMPRQGRDGLIMNSADGGAKWKIIYRSTGKNFGAIDQVNSQNIWAISSGGVIVHLQPK